MRARADQADPEAQNALGNAYTNGLPELRPDYREALGWYQLAADQGFAPAQFNLGLAYELGRGVPVDEVVAFKHYMSAAAQGFAPALFNIGNMYASGRGVAEDHYEAILWYRQAADKGMAEALYNLGIAYEAGRGVKPDEAQAARWYRQAAERGYPLALYNLGLLFEEGRGVAQDFTVAAELYRAAANRGVALAQNNYGLMLHEGRGLARDSVEGLAWISLAVENGGATTARDTVARTLSPEQRDRAALRVGELRQTLTPPTSPPPAAKPAAPAAATTPPPKPRSPRADAPPVVFKSKFANRETGPEAEIATLKKENARLYDELTRASREVVWLNQQQRATRESASPRPETGENFRALADQLAAAQSEIQRLNSLPQVGRASAEPRGESPPADKRFIQANAAAAHHAELSRLADETEALRAGKIVAETRAATLEKALQEQTVSSLAFAKEIDGLNAKFAETRQRLTDTVSELEFEFARVQKLTAETGTQGDSLKSPRRALPAPVPGKKTLPQLPPAPRLPWTNAR